MTTTPWSVTSHKRKINPTTGLSSRKRAKQSPGSNSFHKERQQTLTQAQWIPSRPQSFNDDDDFQPVEVGQRSTKSTSRRRQAKRDSTLTQMNFFADMATPVDLDDDLVEIGDDEAMPPPPIPQLDGACKSPRKPRRRTDVNFNFAELELESHQPMESEASQEYRPAKTWKSVEVTSPVVQTRQSSRRKAGEQQAAQSMSPHHVLANPVINYEYFNGRLSAPRPPPKLVIKDSMASEEDEENSSPVLAPGIPTTPTKRVIVLSSQSPESLIPSRTRKVLSPMDANQARPKTPILSPLQSRSLNSPPYSTVPTTTTLKRPSRLPKTEIDDSQADVFKIPHSSSPTRPLNKSVEDLQKMLPTEKIIGASQPQQEIPATSQILESGGSGVANETQNSLPSLSPLLSRQRSRTEISFAGSVTLGKAESSKTSLSLGNGHTHSPTAEPFMKLGHVSAHEDNLVDEIGPAEGHDEDDVFGSPIPNDTQFTTELKHRSSPAVSSSPSRATRELPDETIGSLQTPRLVPASSAPPEQEDGGAGASDLSLPAPLVSAAKYHIQTTRVPLNDRLSSTSPERSITTSTTQRSIRPASMPHPSQISTQAATQANLSMMSSIPPVPKDICRSSQKVITIKEESSSVQSRLSQLPFHDDQSQLNVHFGMKDEDDDEEEYDLNPPSSRPEPNLPPVGKFLPKMPGEEEIDSSPTSELSQPLHRENDKVVTASGRRMASQTRSPHHRRSRLKQQEQTNNDDEKHDDDDDDQDDGNVNSNNNANANVNDNDDDDTPISSSPLGSPAPLQKPLSEYPQLEGFNNNTQSKFTQQGHITAAYVHWKRETGFFPKGFTPKPYQVPGFRGGVR